MLCRAGLVGGITGAIVLTGCTKPVNRPGGIGLADERWAMRAVNPARQTALLFDRVPGEPCAEDFNLRADWPSTTTCQQGREIISYTTYFNDRQGWGWWDHDQVYRSARYYRFGVQER